MVLVLFSFICQIFLKQLGLQLLVFFFSELGEFVLGFNLIVLGFLYQLGHFFLQQTAFMVGVCKLTLVFFLLDTPFLLLLQARSLQSLIFLKQLLLSKRLSLRLLLNLLHLFHNMKKKKALTLDCP
jgi:hypothetical protein